MFIDKNRFSPEGKALKESEVKQVIKYMLQTRNSITQSQLQSLFLRKYQATDLDLQRSSTRQNEVMYEQILRNVRCHLVQKAVNQDKNPKELWVFNDDSILADITGFEPVYYNKKQVLHEGNHRGSKSFHHAVKCNSNVDKNLIGLLGELFVMNYLQNLYDEDIVNHRSFEEGNGCGYDIELNTGPKCLIEVKSTLGDKERQIVFTKHEYDILSTANDRGELAQIYRVSNLLYDETKLDLLNQFKEDSSIDITPLLRSLYANLTIYHWEDLVDNIVPIGYSLILDK